MNLFMSRMQVWEEKENNDHRQTNWKRMQKPRSVKTGCQVSIYIFWLP